MAEGQKGFLSPRGHSRSARRRPHHESTGAGGEGKGGSDKDYNKAVKLLVPWEGRTSWFRAPSRAPRRLECRRERWWAGLLGERAPRLRRSESGRDGGVQGRKGHDDGSGPRGSATIILLKREGERLRAGLREGGGRGTDQVEGDVLGRVEGDSAIPRRSLCPGATEWRAAATSPWPVPSLPPTGDEGRGGG